MKPRISLRLFGKFSLHCGDQELMARASSRAKEILGYLAVYRRAPVPRETLAGLISSDVSTERSRKALRQALWNLRAELTGTNGVSAAGILQVSDGWVELCTDDLWLDLDEFERTATRRGSRERPVLTPADTTRLAQAIELYRGDLLQGWYQDWCLEERERLRQIYLETLDALVAACEAARDVNAGVAYAIRALHTDPARECTHRALMRLYCLSGDRASAIRQYQRCVEALKTELGIDPDEETRELDRAIRAGSRPGCAPSDLEARPPSLLRAKRRRF